MPLPLLCILLVLWVGNGCSDQSKPEPPAPVTELPAVPFDEDLAFTHLERQVAFGPRNPGSEGHAACLEYLTGELRQYTGDVTRQSFPATIARTGRSVTLTNILATFSGVDTAATGAVLLCAHWDTRPWATLDPDPANRELPIPGANDGASGVAVLLEIARQLHEEPPPQDVLIALWDGEDVGTEGNLATWFLGSRYWAEHPTRNDIHWGVLLDMIGDRELTLPQERISLEWAPFLVAKVWQRGAQLGFRQFQFSPKHAVQDDHLPLLEKGFRVIDIIDFDYAYWHMLSDTPDKCAPASLRVTGVTLLSLVYDYDG
jgi:Zn-dependent M28 family amino/carboxypeptidase